MTASTKPQYRRRTIVTILALVLAVSWWFWPHVDQRFVGKWVRTTQQTNGFGEDTFVFAPDGSGSSGSGRPDESQFHWQVSGSRLRLLYGREPGLKGLIDRLKNLLHLPSRMYEGQLYRVTDITADHMVWQLVSPGRRITAESDEPFELRRAD